MADSAFDFAVFGSGPMAALLAGLLVEQHGRQVCLIADPYSPYRLSRSMHLSTAPVTRPETWALLEGVTAESLALLARIGGRPCVERIEALHLAVHPANIEGLQHALHMARACGRRADRFLLRIGNETKTVYRFGVTHTINSMLLEPALGQWLRRLGVPMINRQTATITRRRDGSISVETERRRFVAERMVLSEDHAIAEHGQVEPDDRWLRRVPATAMLLRTARALPAASIRNLDLGVELSRFGKNAVAAIVEGTGDAADSALGTSLNALAPIVKAGEAGLIKVHSRDGAPFVGSLPGSKSIVIAGLSPYAVFLAPALARFMAGAAHKNELAYFEARGRSHGRLAVAEFVPLPGSAA